MRRSIATSIAVLTLPGAAYAIPGVSDPRDPAYTTFLAHYDGNTGHGGMDADFALGSPVVTSNGGTITSDAKFGAGALNPSGNSTAVGNQTRYPSAGNFSIGSNTAGTIEMWVKTTWNGANDQFLFSAWQPGYVGSAYLYLVNNGTVRAVLDTYSSGGGVWFQQFGAVGSFTDGKYHHIAWNWDLGASEPFSTLYLDGVAQSFAGFGVLQYPGPLAPTIEVGTWQNGYDALQGSIDELRVSNVALYGDEDFTPQTTAWGTLRWKLNGSGNWTTAANWDGPVPNGAGSLANFTDAISAPATVTLDAPQTVGRLNFDNASSYTIDGSSTLTIDAATGSAPAVITVPNGTHYITAPVALADSLRVTVSDAGSAFSLEGSVAAAAGVTITKEGAGVLRMKHVRADGLVVSQGTVELLPGAAANGPDGGSKVTTLSIAGTPAAPIAKLDLTNNSLVIDYSSASPIEDVRQLLLAGVNGGQGIISSSVDAIKRLGYAENSLVGLSSLAGQAADSTSVLIKFTYAGDTNLDGQVDVIDLGNLATAWQTNASWIGGDSNYDGFVDVIDLGMLATNWQAGVGSPLGPGSLDQALGAYGLPGVSVPEPAALGLAGLAGGVLFGRRRW